MEAERSPPARPPPPQRLSSTSGQELRENTANTFRELQRLHDTSHKYINFGLEADERSSLSEACESYKFGLQLINDALKIDCECLPCCSSERKDEAKLMQQKMIKTKQQITFRLQTIERQSQDLTSSQQMVEPSAPPSYCQAMSELNVNSSSQGVDSAMSSLDNSIMDDEPDTMDLTNAATLFRIEDGVQIFYITAQGYVSAPSYPSALHVLRFDDDVDTPSTSEDDNGRRPTCLHVGDWLYPLVPGASPALHTNFGAYMFPDVMSDNHGDFVGLLLPASLPQEERDRFEEIVRSLTVYQEQSDVDVATPSPSGSRELVTPAEEEEENDLSTKISKGILVAADWIAWGVEKSAQKAGEYLKEGSRKLREHIKPAEKAHKIDPRLQKGIVYARQATSTSVKVTGYLIKKLSAATGALAREVAPHISKKTEKFIPNSLKKSDSNGKTNLDGVVQVAASGVQGFGTVYLGMESAAKILAKSLATETVEVVNHKYGEEAGTFAEESMYTAGNAAMTAYQVQSFGVKAIAKRTAKDTGKAVIEDFNQNRHKKGYNPNEGNGGKGPQGGGAWK